MLGLVILLAIATIVLMVVAARLVVLESRIREFERRLRGLESQQREAVMSRPGIVTPPPSEVVHAAAPATPYAEAPLPETGTPQVVSDRPPLLAPEPAPPVFAPLPSRTRGEWEALIGGKLLNRIGALALIIGMGFFLKYAIDNEWINETARVVIGAAVGFMCLLGADRARTRGFQIFSQGLVGAGLAILYLSVYATFNFYHLVPLPLTFGLMGVVTVIAFLEAFRNDSLAVSILACIGGLLTPVMLSTPEPNEIGLFAYLIALNAGLAIVLLRKSSWIALQPLTLIGTYGLYFSWFGEYYTTASTPSALIFLALFWAIFHGLDISRAITPQPDFQDLHRALGWIHTVIAAAALYGICRPHGNSWAAFAVLMAGLLYLVSALLVEWRRPGAADVTTHYGIACSAFFAWAVALEFESFRIVYLWTVEATTLVWVGTRHQRPSLWITGLIVLAVTGLTLLRLDGSLASVSVEQYRLLLNQRALAYVLLAVASIVSAHIIRKAKPGGFTSLVDTLHSAGILLLLILASVETTDLFRSWMIGTNPQETAALVFTLLMVLAMLWAVAGLLLVRLARLSNSRPVVFFGIAASLVAACVAGMRGIAFDPLAAYTPVFNIRAGALLLVAASLFLASRWMGASRALSGWIPEVREAFVIVGVALLLVLLTGETMDIFGQAMAAGAGTTPESDRLENLKQLSLSGGWMVFSIVVMSVGIWRRTRVLRLMAIVLFGVTILKIFIYDLSFLDTLYRIFSFIGLGLILLAVSYLYQRYRSVIIGPRDDERA